MSLPVFVFPMPQPLFALCLAFLAGGFLAYFLGFQRWTSAACALAAGSAAFLSKNLAPFSPAFFALLGLAALWVFFYHSRLKKPWPLILWSAALVVTAALVARKIPGAFNWLVASGVKFSADSMPWHFWVTFDKPLIALIALTLMPSFGTHLPFRKSALYAAFLGGLASLLMMGGALFFGYVQFSPKLPALTFLWLFSNLFLVCPAEEILFRGFMQPSLVRFFGGPNKAFAVPLALLLTSAAFGAAHLAGGPVYMGLAAIAGFLYGLAFHLTGRLGASVAVHATVNTLHFFFFSYPALQGAF